MVGMGRAVILFCKIAEWLPTFVGFHNSSFGSGGGLGSHYGKEPDSYISTCMNNSKS